MQYVSFHYLSHVNISRPDITSVIHRLYPASRLQLWYHSAYALLSIYRTIPYPIIKINEYTYIHIYWNSTSRGTALVEVLGAWVFSLRLFTLIVFTNSVKGFWPEEIIESQFYCVEGISYLHGP